MITLRQKIKKIVPRKYWGFIIQLVEKKNRYCGSKYTNQLIDEYKGSSLGCVE